MAKERIYVDDVTGEEIESPEDATNGGSHSYVGDDIERWRQRNPGMSLGEKRRKGAREDKAAAKAEDK